MQVFKGFPNGKLFFSTGNFFLNGKLFSQRDFFFNGKLSHIGWTYKWVDNVPEGLISHLCKPPDLYMGCKWVVTVL